MTYTNAEKSIAGLTALYGPEHAARIAAVYAAQDAWDNAGTDQAACGRALRDLADAQAAIRANPITLGAV